MTFSDQMRHRFTGNDWRMATRDSVIALAALVAFPTLLWLFMGRFWFLDRGLINIDFVLLGVMIGLLHRHFLALAVFGIVALDAVFAFAPAYHFSPASVAASVSELWLLDPVFTLSRAAIAMVVLIAGTWLMLRLLAQVSRKRHVVIASMVMLVLTLALDAGLVTGSTRSTGAAPMPVNVAFSAANNLRVALTTAMLPNSADVAVPTEAASIVLTNDLHRHALERKVVVVVVESLGSFTDPALEEMQLAPLLKLAEDGRHQVNRGQVVFRGSTVPGELRELCGLQLLTVRPEVKTLVDAECLPEQMAQAGYKTLAVHGFFGSVFSRNLWYPALAFNRIWFANELGGRISDIRRCGIAFRGWCDVDVWRAITHELDQDPEQSQFVYWLTLSAHLPVSSADEGEAARLCRAPELADNNAVCGLMTTHHRLFAALSAYLRTPSGAGVRVLVVGDHMPPFVDQGSRVLFDASRVPFIDIRPRTGRL